jgi:alanine racemase
MLDITSQRPTWADINLDNLAANFHSVKEFVGRNVKYMAVVKADAYGHGAVQCARRLEAEGVDWFGVALPEEGVELRQAGITKLILCLGGFWNEQESLVLNYHLTPVVFQIEKARLLNAAADKRGTVASIHVKVDTGMGRVGVRYNQVREFADALSQLEHLRLEGVMTHFASADDLSQSEFTDLQIQRFHDAVAIFRERGFKPAYLDMANSPGAVGYPAARSNMVRLGGVLYGLGRDVLPKEIEKPVLKPVMSLRTCIADIKSIPAGDSVGYGRTFIAPRDSLIATIPIGYQDGYSRPLSNVGRAIVRGAYAPVVGRISMDWTTLDITDVIDPAIGDEVILIGEQTGCKILAEDLAAATGTISYEITCGINRRVPRMYTPKP